jgi:VanZ family protein
MIWPFLLMVLIFVLSGIPGDAGLDGFNLVTGIDPALQNTLHVPLYATLQILWLRALTRFGWTIKKTVLAGLLLAFGYSILDEIHQGFVPGRYASIMDVGLNLMGCLLGSMIWLFITTRKRSKTTEEIS